MDCGAVRITEVDLHARVNGDGKLLVMGDLYPPIRRH